MNKHRKKKLRRIIAGIPLAKRIYHFFQAMQKDRVSAYDTVKLKYDPGVDEDLSLNGADKVILEWPSNTPKPYVGLVKDGNAPTAYWPKYERFLINNDIKYDFFDIHRSDFLNKSKDFNIILWRTQSNPAEQEEASSKIWILENYLKKLCIPAYDELWFYENKINQYYLCKVNNLPIVNTYVSNSREETLEYIRRCKYPIVSKITTGAGAQGVELIKNHKAAKRVSIKVFDCGLKTYWRYLKQKDYVYYQEYMPNTGYDLRIIVVGDSYFGYRRLVPKDDFRALGEENEDHTSPISEDALMLAKKIKESFPKTRILAVDMLNSKDDDNYYFIEASIFYQVDYPSEMVVNGKLGRYVFQGGKFIFQPGKYWTQELTLQEVMKEWIESRKEDMNAEQDH